jgi:ABC-type transport system substrate-binding protein
MALIEAGKKELDTEKRKKIYWEMEKVLYENYEDAWLWWPIIDTARTKRLVGYDVNLHNIGGEGYWFTHPGYFKDGRRE